MVNAEKNILKNFFATKKLKFEIGARIFYKKRSKKFAGKLNFCGANARLATQAKNMRFIFR